MTTNSPIKYGKLVGHYPLAQLPSKMQLPFNNLLLVSTNARRKKVKKSESSRVVPAPIHHQASSNESRTAQEDSEESAHFRKYGRLRASILNERKKKKIESFNSSFSSIYEKEIKKSKSEVLKKDFESAFKGMIAKKPLFCKAKELRAAQELWASMKMRKSKEAEALIESRAGQVSQQLASRLGRDGNCSEKKLLNRTFNTFYNQSSSISPQVSHFYLTGHQFPKSKIPYIKQFEFRGRGLEMSDEHLKSCVPIRAEGEIKPWNNESRRYKTENNEGKSGEITEWLKGKKIN